MTISVVIPVYNGQRTLPECCMALAAQTYRDFEVIFVDNNSTDASAAVIAAFMRNNPAQNVRLLTEKKQGACAARNRGAREACGEILTHTDPDCIPHPDWLRDIAAAFGDSSITAVAGSITSRQPENDHEIFSALFTLRQGGREAVYRAYTLVEGGYATANLSIRRAVFEALGGFDETINYRGTGIGEDHDLLARMYAAGGTLKAVRGAAVRHWHRSTSRGVFRQGFLFGLAHALLLKRHGSAGLLLTIAGRTFTVSMPGKGWIDGNGIDKKIAALLVVAPIFPPAAIVLAAYLLIQYRKIGLRLRKEGFAATHRTTRTCLLLLIIKCFGMTVGCVRGSLMQRVLCF